MPTPSDPRSSSTDPLYECVTCSARVTERPTKRECPSCGGYLRNIAVPRE